MTKRKAATPPADELTDYAKDQLRRLAEHCERFPMDLGFCATASGSDTVPAIWRGLEESGHVVITWGGEKKLDAYVKPA